MRDHESIVATRVLAARQRARMTREELAVKSGLSWSAITQIESGRRASPRAETLSALAVALGVTADHLLGHDDLTALLDHHALIYDGPEDFVAGAGPFVAAGVDAGDALLVVTPPANTKALRAHLGRAAGRVRFADSKKWYASPRAALGGYRDFIAGSLAKGRSWVRIVGEPVWSDRSPQRLSLWGRYEALISVAFAGSPVTIACPYDQSALAPEVVELARATHCSTVERGQSTPSAAYRDPLELCLGE